MMEERCDMACRDIAPAPAPTAPAPAEDDCAADRGAVAARRALLEGNTIA